MLGMTPYPTLLYGDYVINQSISGFARSMSTPFLPHQSARHAMDAMWMVFLHSSPDQLQRLICLDVCMLDDQPKKEWLMVG